MLDILAEGFLRILAPPTCAACDAPLVKASVFCLACARSVELPTSSYVRSRSAAMYGGAIATAITRFKYGDRADLARPLAHLLHPLAARLRDEARIDLVVPVPLHRSRLRERGYNQAALLAGPVASRLGRPCDARALVRNVSTAPQAALSREVRLTNVVHAFQARRPAAVSGRGILLVDDVRTTGATLASCTEALRAAGAKRVHFLTIAQT